MFPRVHEDIHAGIRGRQRSPVLGSGENRSGKRCFQLGAVDAVTNDDELKIVTSAELGESLDMLLRGQSSDEPDNRLTLGRPGLGAAVRRAPRERTRSRLPPEPICEPAGYLVHCKRFHLPRWKVRQSAVSAFVQMPGPPPHELGMQYPMP